MYVCMYVCAVCMYVCVCGMCVCMCVCMYVCLCLLLRWPAGHFAASLPYIAAQVALAVSDTTLPAGHLAAQLALLGCPVRLSRVCYFFARQATLLCPVRLISLPSEHCCPHVLTTCCPHVLTTWLPLLCCQISVLPVHCTTSRLQRITSVERACPL